MILNVRFVSEGVTTPVAEALPAGAAAATSRSSKDDDFFTVGSGNALCSTRSSNMRDNIG